MKARLAYRFGFAALGVASLVNVVVSVRVFFAMQRPVNYNIRVIEPPVFTNSFISASFELPVAPGRAESGGRPDGESSPVVSASNTNCVLLASERFHYMRVNGRPLCRLNGFNYAVGDVCAYGKIVDIYPERIYIDGGSYISNSRRIFDVTDYVSPAPSRSTSEDNPIPEHAPSFRHDIPHSPS